MKRIKGVFVGIVSFVLWLIALANACYMQLYEQKITSSNMFMDYYMLHTSSCVSGISCSRWCIKDRDCVSFLFNAETSNCTTFSNFIPSESGDSMEQFYVKQGWQQKVICESNITNDTRFVNVALRKPVTLSSLWKDGYEGNLMVLLYIERGYFFIPVFIERSKDISPSEQQEEFIKFKPDALKVDGNRSSKLPCAHTRFQQNPYALIDLLQTYNVFSVYIVNRSDRCWERLHDLKILVGNYPNNLSVCIEYPGILGKTCTFRVPTVCQGRYVQFQILTEGEYLALCEVEVYSIL